MNFQFAWDEDPSTSTEGLKGRFADCWAASSTVTEIESTWDFAAGAAESSDSCQNVPYLDDYKAEAADLGAEEGPGLMAELQSAGSLDLLPLHTLNIFFQIDY